MIFLSCQPHDPYFVWQVEVQIVNFRKFGISDKMHVVVWYPDTDIQKQKGQREEPFHKKEWDILMEKYPEVSFFFYKDSVVDISLYIPVLRPRTLATHFKENPFLEKEVIFYHDSDIIFNYLPDFQELIKGEINWQSNCSGYLDYNYLRKKEIEGKIPENEAVKTLADIGEIPYEIFQSYTGKTGGAQYILRGIDTKFWQDVERMCLEIRRKFFYSVPNSINKRYFVSENAGFQSWCADMWAVNMALWKRNKITDVTPLLDFSWATDSYETFLKKPIYHNAGATRMNPDLFYKGEWINKSPIGKTLNVKKGSASEQYVNAIRDVK